MCAHDRWCKFIFIWMCQSTSPRVCCVSVCLCVWYQIRVPAKNGVMCQTPGNLTIIANFWNFNAGQKTKHFFLIKRKKHARFCRAKIQVKFSAMQSKMRISRLPDSLKLQLKREKCILSSFVIWMHDIWQFYFKNAWNSTSSICCFPNVGQLSYAVMHRDTPSKMRNIPAGCEMVGNSAWHFVAWNARQSPGTKCKSTKAPKVLRFLKYRGSTCVEP